MFIYQREPKTLEPMLMSFDHPVFAMTFTIVPCLFKRNDSIAYMYLIVPIIRSDVLITLHISASLSPVTQKRIAVQSIV